MPRSDAEVKQDLEETQKWLEEARQRLWTEKAAKPVRHEGESAVHFRKRQKREEERRERREEVVEHLANKKKALEKRIEKREDEPEPSGKGYGSFDGKVVPAWTVPWLIKSRAAGWKGYVVSGVRTAARSTELCQIMCNQNTCPGKCAGPYSNHNMEPDEGFPEGALDVSDYYNFEAIQFKIGSPLRNDLPVDPVHFSISGK